MGNTPAELEARISSIERKIEDYAGVIEPKSGSYIGQRWYNTATEVLNAWNGKEYTPAYGKSIVQDIYGVYTLIQQTEDTIELLASDIDGMQASITLNSTQIALKVGKSEVISSINLSTEGIRIQGSKIEIDGTVSFASGYNPTTVQANLTSLQSSLGSLAYDSLVEVAKLGTTVIQGGYIKTTLINAGAISIGSLSGNLDNISDGSTYYKTNFNEKTGAARGYNALNSSNRYANWIKTNEMSSGDASVSTGIIMDSAGLRGYYAGSEMFRLSTSTGSAYFKGNIYAQSGTFTGSITSSATITGGTFRTSSNADAVIIESDRVYFSSGYYLTSGGWFGVTGIRCTGDFNITGDLTIGMEVASSIRLSSIFTSNIELTLSTNKIIGKDGTDGWIYFSAGKWQITRPVVMQSTLECDSLLTITGTSTPEIDFAGIKLRRSGSDIYWGATKLN